MASCEGDILERKLYIGDKKIGSVLHSIDTGELTSTQIELGSYVGRIVTVRYG